jgi:hypothetical protein
MEPRVQLELERTPELEDHSIGYCLEGFHTFHKLGVHPHFQMCIKHNSKALLE